MEYLMTGNPLKPLDGGNVLIIGTKASNFDDELRNHPRIIMWDSQNEHWTNKDIPSNVRAVFMTRFIGHATSTRILAEARKRKLTIFNPDGTGMIVKQVKELLAIRPPSEEITAKETTTDRSVRPSTIEVKEMKSSKKLHALHPFIDSNKSVAENADALLVKAKELGITTTHDSLRQMMRMLRKNGQITVRMVRKSKGRVKVSEKKTEDVGIQVLDDVIKGLQDIRQYLISTTKENEVLRARVDKLKQVLG